MSFVRPHHLIVYGGVIIGTMIGVRFDTDPPIMGIIFGAGGGLSAGAFFAAIFSNTPLVGGPMPRRHPPPGIFDEPPPDTRRDPPAGGAR